MFQKLVFAFSILTLLSACRTDNGKEVTKNFDLDSINSINLMIAAEVEIKKGATQKVEIKGPEKIVNQIVKEVKSDRWDIRLPGNSYSPNYDDLEITITSNQIKEVFLSGAGSIMAKETQPISKVMLTGLGEIQVNTSSREISAVLAGSGDIKLTGKTEHASFIVSGLGSINGYALATNDASVVISGNGSAQVNVASDLNAIISGLGNIKYIGKPSVTTSISGSGTVKDDN